MAKKKYSHNDIPDARGEMVQGTPSRRITGVYIGNIIVLKKRRQSIRPAARCAEMKNILAVFISRARFRAGTGKTPDKPRLTEAGGAQKRRIALIVGRIDIMPR